MKSSETRGPQLKNNTGGQVSSPASAGLSPSRAYVIAFAATVLLSFTGIMISYLIEQFALPSLVVAFWRALFVSLGLLFFFFVARPKLLRIDRHHWPFMLLFGFALATFNSSWTFSIKFNGAAIGTVLAYSSPAFMALISRWLLSEKITGVKIISMILTFIGIILVAHAYEPSAWRLNPLGIFFGLLTGLMFAIYSLFSKQAAEKSINSWTSLLYSFGIGAGFLFVFNLISDTIFKLAPLSNLLWLGTSIDGWVILLLLALGPTIGGFGLYIMSLGSLPATVVNLIAAAEPAFTAGWAYLLWGEQLNTIQLAGAGLILISVILLRVKAQSDVNGR
jgi:drug/metabolite transporter (DMT)-like permease